VDLGGVVGWTRLGVFDEHSTLDNCDMGGHVAETYSHRVETDRLAFASPASPATQVFGVKLDRRVGCDRFYRLWRLRLLTTPAAAPCTTASTPASTAATT
jgi:hypothetical protein